MTSAAQDYTTQMLRIVVAQICQTIGWNSIQSTPLELLVDVLHRYLGHLAHQTHRYAELYERTDPNLNDVALAFQDMNINLADLEEYISYVDSVGCVVDVPKYPIRKEDHLNFLKPGAKEVVTRPVHIDAHLPPMFMENEESSQTNEYAIDKGDSLNEFFNSVEEDKCQVESITDKESEISVDVVSVDETSKRTDLPETQKRNRQFEETTSRPVREISSVMMTSSGFISTSIAGKLPDAKAPIIPKTPPLQLPQQLVPNPFSSTNLDEFRKTEGNRPMGDAGGVGAKNLLDAKMKKKLKKKQIQQAKEGKPKKKLLKDGSGMKVPSIHAMPPSDEPIPSTSKAEGKIHSSGTTKKHKIKHNKHGDGKSMSSKRMKKEQQLLGGLFRPDLKHTIAGGGSVLSPSQHYKLSEKQQRRAFMAPGSPSIDGKLSTEPDKQKLNIFKRMSIPPQDSKHSYEQTQLSHHSKSSSTITSNNNNINSRPMSPEMGNTTITHSPFVSPSSNGKQSSHHAVAQSSGGSSGGKRSVVGKLSSEPDKQKLNIFKRLKIKDESRQSVSPVDTDQQHKGRPPIPLLTLPPASQLEVIISDDDMMPVDLKKEKKSSEHHKRRDSHATKSVSHSDGAGAQSRHKNVPSAGPYGDGTKKEKRKYKTKKQKLAAKAALEEAAASLRFNPDAIKSPKCSDADALVSGSGLSEAADSSWNFKPLDYPYTYPKLPQMPFNMPHQMDALAMQNSAIATHPEMLYPYFPGPGLIPNMPIFPEFFQKNPRFPPPFHPMRRHDDIMDSHSNRSPPPIEPEKAQCNVAPLMPPSYKLTLSPRSGEALESGSISKEKLTKPIVMDVSSSDQLGASDVIDPASSLPRVHKHGVHLIQLGGSNIVHEIEDSEDEANASNEVVAAASQEKMHKEREHKREKKDKDGKVKKKKDKKDKTKKDKVKGEKKKEKEEKYDKESKDKTKRDKKEKKKEKERAVAATIGIAAALSNITDEERTYHESNSKDSDATVVPKLTLKLSTSSPRPETPDLIHRKLKIKPIKKEREDHHHHRDHRDPSPELAKISALVTRPPKSKSFSLKKNRDESKHQFVAETSTPKDPEQTSSAASTSSTGGYKSRSRTNPASSTVTSGVVTNSSTPFSASVAAASSSSATATSHHKSSPTVGSQQLVSSTTDNAIVAKSHSVKEHKYDSPTAAASTTPSTTSTHQRFDTTNNSNKMEQRAAHSAAGVESNSQPPAPDARDSEGNKVWICPACGRVDDGTPMIGCDGCDAWYHWVCVGIQVPPDDSEDWYCRVCILKKQELHTTGEKKKKRKKKDKKSH